MNAQLAIDFVSTRYHRNDGSTSRAAAKAAVSRKADRERAAIIECVKTAPGGLTAREVAAAIDLDWHETSRRISECGLTKTAFVRDGCRVWSAV